MSQQLIPLGLLANGTVPSDPREEGRVYLRLPGQSGVTGITLRQAVQLLRDLRVAVDVAAGFQHPD